MNDILLWKELLLYVSICASIMVVPLIIMASVKMRRKHMEEFWNEYFRQLERK